VESLKYEVVVLCGGEGWRLKPDEWTPKPLLNVAENESLIDFQVHWLRENGFDNIVLASNRSFPESDTLTDPKVQLCIERKKLGTGGATRRAIALIDSDKFYLMNVDDMIFYDPRTLYSKAIAGAAMLLARPQLPFGLVNLDEDIVASFQHRPTVDVWVSAGHYVFSKDVVSKYFPAEGDFEHEAMSQIANDGILRALKYNGDWLTLNTVKDLMRIQDYMRNLRTTMKRAGRH
jgi:NDP-sugar pyrophosphorylase family protein